MHSNYNQLPYSYYTPLELNSVKERETQDVGVFNPVFVTDLIKQKNVDYLEHLCSLCEEIRINPIWFDSQNAQSKHKIIQIYQLAIQYSSNTDSIYQIACEQIRNKTAEKMKAVQNLKREIAEHKEETDEKKKKFKRERLHKEKEKARRYELELIKIRNRLLQEQAQKQQNCESSQESEHPHHMIPPPYMHYPPHYYPHMTPYQHNLHPNQAIPFFGGNNPSNTHSQASLYQNMNGNMQHPQMPFPHLPVPNSGVHSNPNLHNPNPNISSFQAQTEQKNIGQRQSVNRKDTKNSKASNFSLTDSNVVGHEQQEFEQSIQLREDSIRHGTGQFNRADSNNTNILNSQTTKFHDQSERLDKVDDLVDLKNSGMGKGRLSRKQSMVSSDCGGEGDSMMNIVLGPNSARDPDQMPRDLSKHKTSIVKKIPEENEKVSLKSSSYQLRNSNQKYSTPANDKFKDLDMQIREKQGEYEDSSKYSLIQSRQKNPTLLMSNQGGKKVDFIGRLEFKDESMKSDNMMNSMQDIQSPRKSHLGQSMLGEPKQNIQEKDQYESDFDNSSDNKEPVIKILSSRNTSTIMPPKYLALAKGYFLPKLKSDFLSPDFHEESIGDSVIGSLKELTVHMSATGQKKSHKNPAASSRISDFDLEMDMIQMPENSRIARPSYDKKSTIRKTINFKITDSLESNNNLKLPPRQSNQTKSQRNHVLETPEIQLQKKKSEEISIEKLADVALAESHVLQQTQYEIKDEPQQKIELSQFNKQDSINLHIEDEQSQQKTKINLKNKKRQHILELIQNRLKIQMDKSQHFDTLIIKNAIKKQIKNTEELGYSDVIEIFDQKTEKIKQKLSKLKKQNKKKQIQRENQKVIEKQKNRESNLEKTKKSSEEDLTYSRSMIQDPNKMGSKIALEKSNLSGQNKDDGKQFIQLSGSILTKKKVMTEISEVSAEFQKQSKDIKTEVDSIMPNIPMKSKVNSKSSQSGSKEAPKYAMTSSKEQVNISQINRKNKLNIDDELEMALPIAEQKQEDEDDF